jgi:hypothetical protein
MTQRESFLLIAEMKLNLQPTVFCLAEVTGDMRKTSCPVKPDCRL